MKGGETMRKAARILVTVLVVTIIMIISIAGIAMAKGPYYGECPNPDCPNAGECPNPDCPNTSMILADGSGTQTQSQLCNAVCNQNQFTHQFSDEGNCFNKQHCRAFQNRYGVNPTD